MPPDFLFVFFNRKGCLTERAGTCFQLHTKSAPNHDWAREMGPPATTRPPTRLAKDHNPTMAPAAPMVATAPLEISAWAETEVCALVFVLALRLGCCIDCYGHGLSS